VVGLAVGDGHDDAAAGVLHRHADAAAQGQAGVRGGHGILVEDLAAAGAPAVVPSAVPACLTRFLPCRLTCRLARRLVRLGLSQPDVLRLRGTRHHQGA